MPTVRILHMTSTETDVSQCRSKAIASYRVKCCMSSRSQVIRDRKEKQMCRCVMNYVSLAKKALSMDLQIYSENRLIATGSMLDNS